MDCRLFGVSCTGGVGALLELIKEDRLILHTTTLASSDNPLHIAALFRHTEFTRMVMQLNPELARELNNHGLSPIHIASSKGHEEIVKELLKTDQRLCLLRDSDGNIPLHSAAIKGSLGVLPELLNCCPASFKELTWSGETVLHLAVKNNKYEALALFISHFRGLSQEEELVNSKDEEGNTILHLAIAGKQFQTVQFLMKETHVEVNAVNSNGLTALDLLLTLPTDSNEDSIAKLLKNAGGERAFNPPTQVLSPQVQSPEPSLNQNFTNSSSRSDKGESIRNGIIILSVMFATLAFEVALSPPGGLWQEWDSIANQNSTISKIVHLKKNKGHLIPAFPKVSPANYHKPGKVITWELASKEFSKFLVSNALCFYTSLFGIIGAVIPKKFDYDLRIFIFLVLFSAGSLYATGLTLVTEWKVTKWVFQSVILFLAFGFTTFFLIKLLIKNKVWRRIKRNVVCY